MLDIKPQEIDYINAHGSSTRMNDIFETNAYKAIFGDYAYKLPISSLKSMIGHPLAAANAIEMTVCSMIFEKNILPPTINQEEKDPLCDLNYIPNTGNTKKSQHHIKNQQRIFRDTFIISIKEVYRIMERIAVTGIGIVSPSGIGKRQFWANIKSAVLLSKKLPVLTLPNTPRISPGKSMIWKNTAMYPKGCLKKLMPFRTWHLIASEMALQDAGIDIKNEDPNLVGIFLGNAIGGWLYAETELRDLYIEGREGVSPYMASAWFPAAPQGQVSIYYGIKGFSKTVVADRASSSMAIGYARKVLSKDKLNMILAGGMEAPVTPYALLCCNTYGALSKNNSHPDIAYRPFDKKRDGCVIAEGAGIVVMEGIARAKARKANIFAYISGYGTTCDGVDRINPASDGVELARAIKMALSEAKVSPDEIDYISFDGLAVDIWDDSEIKAIKSVFGNRIKDIPVSCPKSMFGNLLGASGAVDLIITILAMEHNLVPPTINLDEPCINGLNFIKKQAKEYKIDKALIISRGRGGINSALVIEKQ